MLVEEKTGAQKSIGGNMSAPDKALAQPRQTSSYIATRPQLAPFLFFNHNMVRPLYFSSSTNLTIVQTTPTNDPPSYDEVPKQQQQPEGRYLRTYTLYPCSQDSAAFNDVKVIPQPEIQPAPAYTMPGPSNYLIQPVNNGQTPIVYRYINHSTGEQVASLLPPTHPEMICLQSGHVPHTNYGILGTWRCCDLLLRS